MESQAIELNPGWKNSCAGSHRNVQFEYQFYMAYPELVQRKSNLNSELISRRCRRIDEIKLLHNWLDLTRACIEASPSI